MEQPEVVWVHCMSYQQQTKRERTTCG